MLTTWPLLVKINLNRCEIWTHTSNRFDSLVESPFALDNAAARINRSMSMVADFNVRRKMRLSLLSSGDISKIQSDSNTRASSNWSMSTSIWLRGMVRMKVTTVGGWGLGEAHISAQQKKDGESSNMAREIVEHHTAKTVKCTVVTTFWHNRL